MIADFEALHLEESDILLLTTRPPLDDKGGSWKSLCAFNSAFEGEIFEVLRQKCFHHCSRKEVVLHTSVGRNLKDGYQNRLHIEFEVKGQQASYTGVFGGEAKKYEPWAEKMSAGYIIHVPLGPHRPRLLAIFGMGGTLTLLWCYRLSKLRHVLEQALSGPSLTMAEL